MKKAISYNRTSHEGTRLHRMLMVGHNAGHADQRASDRAFTSHQVPAVMSSRIKQIEFLIASSLAGVSRPQIRVDANIEKAWGDFPDDVSVINFKHNKQELPITYIQPITDDVLKTLIDAGLYSDPNFEALLQKVMHGERFDAEGLMHLSKLDIPDVQDPKQNLSVLMADPVHIVHEDHDPSTRTTLALAVTYAAQLIMELRNENANLDAMISDAPHVPIVVIDAPARDVTSAREEQAILNEATSALSARSELLGETVDLTGQIDPTKLIGKDAQSQQISRIKERDRVDVRSRIADVPEPGLDEVVVLDPNQMAGMMRRNRPAPVSEPHDDGPDF